MPELESYSKSFSSGTQVIGEILLLPIFGAMELLPRRIRTVDEVKEFLIDVSRNDVVRDGSTLTFEDSNVPDWSGMYDAPSALEDRGQYSINRSMKAGATAIRSGRIVSVLQLSNMFIDQPNSFAVNVPIGSGNKPVNFTLPSEQRYYPSLQAEGDDLALHAAALGIFEVSKGIDGQAQRKKLAQDIKAHNKAVKKSGWLYGDAARQSEKESDEELFAQMREYQKRTGKDPMDPVNAIDFMTSIRK